MPGRLDGKVAVITGGTSGIGEATARRFAAEGARVVIAGRSIERSNALASELGERAFFFRADVMHEAEVAALIDAAVARFGQLDCLFNNAGAAAPGEIDQHVDAFLGHIYVGGGTCHHRRVDQRRAAPQSLPATSGAPAAADGVLVPIAYVSIQNAAVDRLGDRALLRVDVEMRSRPNPAFR